MGTLTRIFILHAKAACLLGSCLYNPHVCLLLVSRATTDTQLLCRYGMGLRLAWNGIEVNVVVRETTERSYSTANLEVRSECGRSVECGVSVE